MLSAAALSSFTVLMLLASTGRNRPTRAPVSESDTPHPPVERPMRRRRPLVIALGGVASLMFFGPAITVALGLGVVAWPHTRRIVQRRHRQAAIDAALPDAIEMLILVVRAGMTPHQAVTMLTERAPVPVRPAFVEVDRRRARGATLADALSALPDLVGPGANVVADTLAMAERYGTPITDALEQLSVDVRERRVRQAEAEARKLPIRMSFPLVVCTLPSFVLIAIVPAVLGALSSLDGTGF
ncbi:MAG: type II secretion system F family protein [Ilumatobacter sp.]|uniref:type II secretion system F family protein n=1 Tax=Ilumatobacter sp. TaxID=1967498 RepID=UPI003C75364F